MRNWIDIARTLNESHERPANVSDFYLGLDEPVKVFDETTVADGKLGRGIYLSTSPAISSEAIMHVTATRPLNTITSDEAREHQVPEHELVGWAEENGYDGVWLKVANSEDNMVWELACAKSSAFRIEGQHLDEGKKKKKRKKRKSRQLGAGPVYNISSDGGGADGGGGGGD